MSASTNPMNDPANTPESVHWRSPNAADPTAPEGEWSDATATIEDVIQQGQEWRVIYEGAYWKALPAQANLVLMPGDTVRVLGRQGNDLLVQV